MIAVAQPKLSSRENRKRIKAARAAGLAYHRAVNRRVQEDMDARSAPRLKGTLSNSSLKAAEGARLARERRARKKKQRLAARPRTVVMFDARRARVLSSAALVIGVLAGIAAEKKID